jgi:hypothetical protein
MATTKLTPLHMKIYMTLLFAAVTFTAYAQPMPAGLKEMIITGGLSGGKTYQVAAHCGASAEDLKAYKNRFDAEIRGGEKLYAELGIDIQEVFRQGRKEGDAIYESMKGTPKRADMCEKTIALLRAK